jgi:hypothetical protein
VAESVISCAVHNGFQALGPCPRCGTFACAQCMLALPNGEQLCRACEAKGVLFLPWDRRDELGIWRAFFKTCFQIMGRPSVTFACARPDAPLSSTFFFALLASASASLTTGFLYGFVVGGVLSGDTHGEGSKPAWQLFAFAAGTGLATIASLVVWHLGSMVVMGSLEHLTLRVVGARPASWSVTMRAYALAMAPAVIGLVPYCSIYVIPIWSIVARVFGYRELHRTTTGKAAIAAVMPTVAIILLLMAAYVAMFAMMVR